jgi:hypothetical protein
MVLGTIPWRKSQEFGFGLGLVGFALAFPRSLVIDFPE